MGVVGGTPEREGGGELVNLPYAKTYFSAAMLLGDEDEYGTLLFHSVIFNSVAYPLGRLDFASRLTFATAGFRSRMNNNNYNTGMDWLW